MKNDTGIEDANNGNGRKSTLKSDRSKSSLEIPEDVTELVDEAIRAYEFRVKYYEELIRETVNEFEGGLKRAHVDELSILIEEASEETKQMQSVCQKIVRSLGRLIPVIYQSIEILEFQVKADTGSYHYHYYRFTYHLQPSMGWNKRKVYCFYCIYLTLEVIVHIRLRFVSIWRIMQIILTVIG